MSRDNERQGDTAESIRSTVERRGFSRRRWLQLFGAGSAGLVAGCGGGDSAATDTEAPTDSPTDETGGDTDTSEDDSGTPTDSPTPRPEVEDPMDDTLNWITSAAKQRHGYNGFNPTTEAIQEVAVMQERFARYDVSNTEWLPRLVADWELGDDTATITLDDSYGWHTGDPVTAEDIYTQRSLGIDGPGENSIFDSVEIVEGGAGGTLEFGLVGETNPSILTRALLDYGAFQNEEVYGEFATRMREASSSDEKNDVLSDLEEFTYRPTLVGGDHEPNEILSSGPFMMSQMTNKRIIFEPNEHHPVGQTYNFNLEMRWTKDANAEKPMMRSDTTDVSREELSPQFIETLPDNWNTYYYPAYGGNAIDFLLDDDLFSSRPLRQALNFMIDQQQLEQANPTPATGVQYHSGMADFIAESWLDGDFLDSLTHYEQDFDRAASLLEEAGFTQDGSTWLTPGGDTFSFDVELPSGNTNRIKETEVALQHCKDFGIEGNVQITEASTYWSTYRSGDWPTGVKFWAFGDRGRAHPAYDFDSFVWIGNNYEEDERAWNQQPWTVEVPMPVGDPEGDLQEINWWEKTSELANAQSEDEERELIKENAWIYNQYLPKIPTTNTVRMAHVTTDHWNTPSEDYIDSLEASSNDKICIPLREGRLTAKPK